MGVLGLKLILETPWLGFGSLALLFALTRIPQCPAAPIALAAAMIAEWATGKVGIASVVAITPGTPPLVVPSWPEVWHSFQVAVLPQLSLTLTNAVIVTASLSRELFPSTGSIASERRLALSSGLANVLLCPLGAMPMCHGAGGLTAQFLSARALAFRRSFSAPCCSSSRSPSPITPLRCSRSFQWVRSARC